MQTPADDGAIAIQFELNATDVARSRVWAMWRRWTIRVLYAFMAVAAIVMTLAALTVGIDPSVQPSLLFVSGFAVVFPTLIYAGGLQMFRGISAAQRTVTYRVTSDSIDAKSGVGESKLNWQSVQEADETANYFFMWPAKGIVYPIPKRGFQDASGAVRFRELLREKLGKKARVRRS